MSSIVNGCVINQAELHKVPSAKRRGPEGKSDVISLKEKYSQAFFWLYFSYGTQECSLFCTLWTVFSGLKPPVSWRHSPCRLWKDPDHLGGNPPRCLDWQLAQPLGEPLGDWASHSCPPPQPAAPVSTEGAEQRAGDWSLSLQRAGDCQRAEQSAVFDHSVALRASEGQTQKSDWYCIYLGEYNFFF